MEPTKETTIIGWGKLPCLHCGEIILISGEIHLCDAPRFEWVNKQEEAYIQFGESDVWDLKNKKIIRK